MNKKQKKMLLRIVIAAVLMVILHFAAKAFGDRVHEPVWFFLYLIPYLTVGYDILLKAVKGIKNRQVFDENFLMAVATIGAIAIALINRNGDYTEAIAVMLFYQVGELFQSYAVGKSRKNISALMDIRPDYANVEENGELRQIDPDEVEIGTVIVVKPGEKIPIDGTVVDGVSTLDTSALTGESVPREVRPGDEVISGCINQNGLLKLRTTKEFGESTVSKILDMVENATSKKSRSEAFISRFARIYTPAVCLCALALAILPPLFFLANGRAPGWGDWVYRALTFLVISCPCALVISIPLSFFAGIGGASREGVLVKGSNYLEALSKAKTVAFDKTGTMTMGVFEVNGIHHSSMDNEKLLELAAHAEIFSTHPIARSIQKAWLEGAVFQHNGEPAEKPADLAGRTLDRARVGEVREIGGNGIIAEVDGRQVAAGNTRLMDSLGVPYINCSHAGTIVHVAVDGAYAGHLLISDVIKPTAKEAIRALHEAGVTKTVMLTGDTREVGEAVAKEIGIDEVQAELLPGDKVAAVEALLAKKPEHSVLAFVGDGINDAPVLTRADVGVAMGALGSDAAIEAADVVLMDDDPKKIALAIRIAKKCMRIVYENIWFAIGVKLICLVLGAAGVANMWLAIFADVGVMVLAVLNAIRALFTKNLRA
ncbi:MAG: heavy metal translocating P-type ATPase [Oscillospiraceae bacterium]|nr:heavy metal translocating P-type ATPase [Oscillospiraceae bacterium]